MQYLFLAILASVFFSPAYSETFPSMVTLPTRPHVLLVGLDGVRVDALLRSHTPTFDSLRRVGAFSDSCLSVLPSSSGPGWTSILTGQGPAGHGVKDNTLNGWSPSTAPTLPSLLRRAGFQGRISAATHWEPLTRLLFEADEVYDRNDDKEVEYEALRMLEFEDPEFLFVHLDAADHMGHTFGFAPWIPTYRMAIEGLDRNLGRICAGLRARPNFIAENWLIVVTSDHGGHFRHHGEDCETDRRIFLLVVGGDVERGSDLGATSLVDVTPTILTHLKVSAPKEILITGTSRLLNQLWQGAENAARPDAAVSYSTGASLRMAR